MKIGKYSYRAFAPLFNIVLYKIFAYTKEKNYHIDNVPEIYFNIDEQLRTLNSFDAENFTRKEKKEKEKKHFVVLSC